MAKKNDIPATSNHHFIGIGRIGRRNGGTARMFDHMPPNTGFSFVVIQHLSPDHKSLLSELLARHTMMQVFEAQEGVTLQPQLYLCNSK